MESGGTIPAGSGRKLRLDPFALPVRFPAEDAGADGHIRHIELDRERVVLRRAVRGMQIRVRVPVSGFSGIAMRTADAAQGPLVTVTLEHRDRAMSVPLFCAADCDEVVAIWRAWGRVLGLPLLIVDEQGNVCEPFPRMGGVVDCAEPSPRRRRRSALKRRRPSILMRRRMGKALDPASVHREREIIARN